MKVTAFEVDHRPIKPAFGYRIEHEGRVVVLSGDTRKSENLVKFSTGADVIMHEVGEASEQLMRESETVRRVVAHHTSPEEAAEIFNRLKPRLAVYSHFAIFGIDEKGLLERTRKTYSGRIESGVDLMQIDVGDEIKVQVIEGGTGSGNTVVPGKTGD